VLPLNGHQRKHPSTGGVAGSVNGWREVVGVRTHGAAMVFKATGIAVSAILPRRWERVNRGLEVIASSALARLAAISVVVQNAGGDSAHPIGKVSRIWTSRSSPGLVGKRTASLMASSDRRPI